MTLRYPRKRFIVKYRNTIYGHFISTVYNWIYCITKLPLAKSGLNGTRMGLDPRGENGIFMGLE